ncbi:MAG: DUF6790 family protein [Rhodomicrobium sp.]
MYLIAVILLLFIFPAASVLIDMLRAGSGADWMLLVGKWFVFWAVGVRLFIAGLRQVFQPRFTAETIFEIKDESVYAVVREVGFGNISIGALGLLSLADSRWVVPAAIVGGLYYGLAGVGHVFRGKRNFSEWTALISDLFIFGLLAAFVASRGF